MKTTLVIKKATELLMNYRLHNQRWPTTRYTQVFKLSENQVPLFRQALCKLEQWGFEVAFSEPKAKPGVPCYIFEITISEPSSK